MISKSAPRNPSEIVELGPEDIIEIVEVRRIDPRSEPLDEPVHKVFDTCPPSEETELRDTKTLARVLDRAAVPKRVRIEMVTAPLSAAAVDVLRAVDGNASVAEIVEATKLGEDAATAGLQHLVQLGVIAFR